MRQMQHIPEDELHAYLDQALSRSRCVVIESHLANCAACSSQRDAIAALRDQTTLLLGTMAPPRRIPVSLEELERRVAAERPRRTRNRRALWAASIIGALALGYGFHPADRPEVIDIVELPAGNAGTERHDALPPAVAPAPAVIPAAMRPASQTPGERLVKPEPGTMAVASTRRSVGSPSVETSTSALPTDPDPGLDGYWRTVPWDKAEDVAGQAPARVEGVPVEEVQVQPSRQGGGTMMVVAQRLSSGQVIQTIEGPTADVSKLLSRRGDGGLDSAGRPAEAVQRGDRMLVVTGELPPDSLRAMVRRVNAAMRVR